MTPFRSKKVTQGTAWSWHLRILATEFVGSWGIPSGLVPDHSRPHICYSPLVAIKHWPPNWTDIGENDRAIHQHLRPVASLIPSLIDESSTTHQNYSKFRYQTTDSSVLICFAPSPCRGGCASGDATRVARGTSGQHVKGLGHAMVGRWTHAIHEVRNDLNIYVPLNYHRTVCLYWFLGVCAANGVEFETQWLASSGLLLTNHLWYSY